MAGLAHGPAESPRGGLLEQRFVQAMAAGELVVHYQPRVDAVTRRLLAVEALVRWNHPQLGLIGPGAFIPMAERTGRVAELGARVLEQACADAAGWHRLGMPVRVSVNVSPRQLELQDLPMIVARSLALAGLAPQALELEITEGLPLSREPAVVEALERIHELGVSCAIDDFGKGYSLAVVLRDVPVQVVKIDQALVGATPDVRRVGSFVELARSLGIRVVAEGVEDEGQRVLLAGAGCDEIQGHLICRAVPASRITRAIEQRQDGVERWPAVSSVCQALDEQALAALLLRLDQGLPARLSPPRRRSLTLALS
jgi:EAL domain-containing protein (putative c-di-GMP-specific phosphodiesterase class I)